MHPAGDPLKPPAPCLEPPRPWRVLGVFAASAAAMPALKVCHQDATRHFRFEAAALAPLRG